MKTELDILKQISKEEKTVFQAGQLLRTEIKNMTDTMHWPPRRCDLSVDKINLGNFLSKFLNVLLSGKITEIEASRMFRIKLSIGQDIVYTTLQMVEFVLLRVFFSHTVSKC